MSEYSIGDMVVVVNLQNNEKAALFLNPYITLGTRGLFAGLYGGSFYNLINYITITTEGNANNFGNLSGNDFDLSGSCSSATRGIFAGNGAYITNIEYVDIASLGDSKDFGDLRVGTAYVSGLSSPTRGIFSGGDFDNGDNYWGTTNIDYITIATLGGSAEFGELTVRRVALASCASHTRGIISGGESAVLSPYAYTINRSIDYIEIASLGSTADFGNLNAATAYMCSCSSRTRGVIAGGAHESVSRVNTIDYIEIASNGDATDFGDLTAARNSLSACSSQLRGLFAGGSISVPRSTTIDYITFVTKGVCTDFGDLTVESTDLSGCSDCHGGLS
jgi:hypothetical protein